MTEEEWRTSTNPLWMLESLLGKVSDRKVRLFQIACCRCVWDHLPDEACREAVTIAERYADGEVGDKKRRATRNAIGGIRTADEIIAIQAKQAAWIVNEKTFRRSSVHRLGVAGIHGHLARQLHGQTNDATDPYRVAFAVARVAEAEIVRCIVGSLFRAVFLAEEWRTGTVLSLARQMYEGREFSAMPILADALQDAGCDNTDILAHCRGPGPHVRGCWVVDLILGKE